MSYSRWIAGWTRHCHQHRNRPSSPTQPGRTINVLVRCPACTPSQLVWAHTGDGTCSAAPPVTGSDRPDTDPVRTPGAAARVHVASAPVSSGEQAEAGVCRFVSARTQLRRGWPVPGSDTGLRPPRGPTKSWTTSGTRSARRSATQPSTPTRPGRPARSRSASIEALPDQTRRVRAVVRDHGGWLPERAEARHRRRGIFLMSQFMDEVAVRPDVAEGGTEVVLARPRYPTAQRTTDRKRWISTRCKLRLRRSPVSGWPRPALPARPSGRGRGCRACADVCEVAQPLPNSRSAAWWARSGSSKPQLPRWPDSRMQVRPVGRCTCPHMRAIATCSSTLTLWISRRSSVLLVSRMMASQMSSAGGSSWT